MRETNVTGGEDEGASDLLAAALREGDECEVKQSPTLLATFLRDPLNDIPQPVQADITPVSPCYERWVSHMVIHAFDGMGINVRHLIKPLLYDLSEGIFYPSLECIAGIVLACQALAKKPVQAGEVFDRAKIRAALASATARPPSGRPAHNVRQVFGDGCPEDCRFCSELLILSSGNREGREVARLTVSAGDLRPLADVLVLSTRTARAMAHAGIETIFHLRQLTERGLASYKDIGERTRAEVVAEAQRAGIQLGSIPNPAGRLIPMRELQPVPPRRKPAEN